MTRRRASQAGYGNLGCIFWALLLAAVLLVLWKAVPVKYANAALHSHLEELAKFSAERKPEQLKQSILAKARDLNLPIGPKQVRVEKSGDRIKMRCTYTVPLEFPFFTWEWKVDLVVDRPIYYV